MTPPPVSGVRACIALPRVSFTASQFDLMGALFPLGIPVAHKCGIWWGQMLTGLIETVVADPACRYVLTVDYDSRFVIGDVLELYRLMESHPEADAIAPVQIRRGTTHPLFTIRDPATGENVTSLPADAIQGELLRVSTAHMGLTMMKADAIRALPRPWFWTKPDTDGGWDVRKGALQEDVFFWRQWEAAGRTLFVAPQVKIGHGCESVLHSDQNLHGVTIELSEYERMRDAQFRASAPPA